MKRVKKAKKTVSYVIAIKEGDARFDTKINLTKRNVNFLERSLVVKASTLDEAGKVLEFARSMGHSAILFKEVRE
jgi:hypothetical protein